MTAENEVVTESWRTDKHPNAKELRDRKAEELQKQGWTIDCYAADLGQFSVYGLSRRRTS